MKFTAKQETIIANSSLSASLLLFLLVIFGMILTGCSRENIQGSGRVITDQRPIADFEDIIVQGEFDVQIKQGQLQPVVIEAEDNLMHVIETFVSGSRLTIKVRNGVNLKNFRRVKVTVQGEHYRKIIFSGSGSLRANDTITSSLFTYEINGSADAHLKLKANEVRTIVNGSGNINLEGTANDYHSEINGSGDIDATNLQSRDAHILISGSGGHHIWVLDLLDVRINGSGNVRYKGTPGTLNTSIHGSGKVSQL